MGTSTLPPAIVWGIDAQIGLWIVRELGQHGIPVIGLAGTRAPIGGRSRYLKHAELARPRGPELLAQIRALGETWGPCMILAVSEVNALYLAENRNALGNVRALVPDVGSLRIALDKNATLALATQLGIPVPVTLEFSCPGDIDRLAATAPYPLVLKWADTNAIAPTLEAAGIDLLKAEYVHDRDEFVHAMRRYDRVGKWPLAQQYCPGRGLGQFFFLHNGEVLRRFQHRRVAEWPPEGGFSAVCDAVPLDQHRDLQERSIELLRRMAWEGVAMVEYRFDDATGHAVLMEVNGRYWGSFPLAAQSGAAFALLHYYVQGMGRGLELPPPRTDLRCRMVSADTKRLMRILFAPRKIADKSFGRKPLREVGRYLLGFVHPRVRYYVWTLHDPIPFLVDLGNYLVRFLG